MRELVDMPTKSLLSEHFQIVCLKAPMFQSGEWPGRHLLVLHSAASGWQGHWRGCTSKMPSWTSYMG